MLSSARRAIERYIANIRLMRAPGVPPAQSSPSVHSLPTPSASQLAGNQLVSQPSQAQPAQTRPAAQALPPVTPADESPAQALLRCRVKLQQTHRFLQLHSPMSGGGPVFALKNNARELAMLWRLHSSYGPPTKGNRAREARRVVSARPATASLSGA